MPNGILAGVRNLRSSMLTGAILLASLYVVATGDGASQIPVRASAQDLLKLHERMPLLLAGVACYLAGSLYTTALEGLVDWIHRKLLFVESDRNEGRVRRAMLSAFAPLSDSSRRRLQREAERFRSELAQSCGGCAALEDGGDFVQKVFADVLWMEGKLTGLPLRETYDEYRAEGEFRLGVGLLLPLGAIAVAYAIQLSWEWFTLAVMASTLVAVQTCNYGLYYYRRAHSFLAHHVADGTLLTPSMETVKRTSNAKPGEVPKGKE